MFLHSKRLLSLCGLGILAGIASLLLSARALSADFTGPPAEGFKTLPINPLWLSTVKDDKEKARIINDTVKKIIGGQSITGSETQFDGYFSQVVFPQWTQTTEKNLTELPKSRDSFLKFTVEASAKNPAAHARLIDVTHTQLSKIVGDEGFHPAVRYNAILVIGQLNEIEPNRGTGTKQMPEPYTKALSTLLAELKKPGNNEAVRVGALLGVSRHLEWDNSKPAMSLTKIQAAVRTEIVDELNLIVNTKVPPAGRSLEGQTWLRRRALEGLGHANALKVDPAFDTLLQGILADDTEPISLRCTAAEVMSHVVYQAPAVPNVTDVAKKLGYLGLYACHTEILRLEGLKKKDEELLRVSGGVVGGPGGMGGGMGGGMMPGGAGAGGMMPGGMMPGGPAGGTAPGGGGIPGAGGMMPGAGGMMPGAGGAGRRGGAGPMMPGMPGAGGADTSNDPKAYRVDYSKRRLRAELHSVQLALGRSKRAAPPEGLYVYAKAEPETTTVGSPGTELEFAL